MAKFKAPRSILVTEKSNFVHKNTRHETVVLDHYFNCSVDVFIPGTKKLPQDLLTSYPTYDVYWHVLQLPIVEFTSVDFIETFIKKGNFYALTYSNHVDTDNVVAVTSTGKLILSLDKDTYEELGLEGKQSLYNNRNNCRKYFIEIDLVADTFKPGKKNYERVAWCLGNRLDLCFDFVVAWAADDQSSQSSLQSYLGNYMVTPVTMKETTAMHKHLRVPIIKNCHLEGCVDESHQAICCDHYIFHEWLGAIACDCDCAGFPDGFVSTYSCPEPHSSVKHSVLYRCLGLITPQRILIILQSLRNFLKKSDIPWASLTVNGFSDSPVSWKNKEHGFLNSGENMYTFVIFPDDSYWLFMAVSSHDICP